MQNDPSSTIIPLLNLTGLQADKPKNPTALKVRFTSRLSLTDMTEFASVPPGLSSDRSFARLNQPKTLIDPLSLGEEECAKRYAVDPFFRQKVQSQLSSLKKASSLSLNSYEVSTFIPVEKTMKLIEEDNNITYRQVKQIDKKSHGSERAAFDRMIRQAHVVISRKGKQNEK